MFIFILVATLDNDEDEFSSAGFVLEKIWIILLLKTRDKPEPRQAILMLAVITYHYLSCMFSLLKFYKNLIIKTIFDVAIYYYKTISLIIMPVVETWLYQAHSHLMVYLPSKDLNQGVPKWTP